MKIIPVAIYFPEMKYTKILQLNIFTNMTVFRMKVSAVIHYLLSFRKSSYQITTTFFASKNKGNYDSHL